MATLTITSKTEQHLADIIANTTHPQDAAINILSFLRNAKSERANIDTTDNGLTVRTIADILRFLKKNIKTKGTEYGGNKSIHVVCDGNACTFSVQRTDQIYSATVPSSHQCVDFVISHLSLYNALKGADKNVTLEFSQTPELITIVVNGNPIRHITTPPTYPPEELPTITPHSPTYTTRIDKDTAKSICDFTSNDEQYVIGAVNFTPQYIAAANGFILYYNSNAIESEDNPDNLINSGVLLDIAQYTHNKSDIDLQFSASHVTLIAPSRYGATLSVYTVTTEGSFPDVHRIMPPQENTLITLRLEKQELDTALDAVKGTVSKCANITILSIDASTNTVMLQSGDTERSVKTPLQSSSIDTKETAPFEIAFNVKYMQTIVDSFDCDELEIRLQNSNQPITVVASDRSSLQNQTCVIMPMHLSTI
jgi:hypothetical protein